MFLKRLSPRTLFSLTPSSSPSPYSIFISQCSSSSPSHLTYPHSHSHPDSRNVRVSVWWDLENCNVPSGVNVFRGAQAITAAIESSGIKGPIQITAFGDMLRLARTNQEALSSTGINFPGINFSGINFTHIPHGGEDSADRSLFRDLMYWVSKNPPPAHLFLITVDGGSASILRDLRMDNYNILLASKESASGLLKSAATIMWYWDALVRGENLTGSYFNQPPKGSWYGHYDGPLEDPFKLSKIKTHEVFSRDSFWRDVETFINTDLGSLIIVESRAREKMAYHLRNYGPSVLKSVRKSYLLLMVDILISEKEWVLEVSPWGYGRPFKLTSSAGITSANSDCTDVNDEFGYSDSDFSDFSDSDPE